MKSVVIDREWGTQFDRALSADIDELLVISPFIKAAAISRILKNRTAKIRVLTRFNLNDFATEVSDISAIQSLIDAGASVRGVRNLHAKLYIFGKSRAFVTSANLTMAGLERNHEFGVSTCDDGLVGACLEYFESIWNRAGTNIEISKVLAWEKEVLQYRLIGGEYHLSGNLMDEGANLEIPASNENHSVERFSGRNQAFIKFLGKGDYRASLSNSILDEIKESGCYWALTYPKNKRPRSVNDGAVMFIARLIDNGDIMIYGRAIGLAYREGRDDASDEDIAFRKWKAEYPHYIRVYGSEFVNGILENGVSFSDLMTNLGPECFASTQRRARDGEINIRPQLSIRRQAAIKLSNEGAAWVTQQLESKLAAYGNIPPDKFRSLDWPAIPECNY